MTKQRPAKCHEYGDCPGIKILGTTIEALFDKHEDIHAAVKETNATLVRNEEKSTVRDTRRFRTTNAIIIIFTLVITAYIVKSDGIQTVQAEHTGQLIGIAKTQEATDREVDLNHEIVMDEIGKIKVVVKVNALAVGTNYGPEF